MNLQQKWTTVCNLEIKPLGYRIKFHLPFNNINP